LAAAYAADGQFSSAIQTAERALQLARTQNDLDLAYQVQRDIDVYSVKLPLRDRD
jgi:hypothetical protein